MSIPGAGKVAVDEQTAEQIISDPYDALRGVRPEFMRNFGEVPIEQPKTQEEVNEMLTESAGEARKINRVIREELDEFLSGYRNQKVELSESESAEFRQKLRKRQIDEDLTQIEDALIDVCARQLREGGKVSEIERTLLENTINQ
jgi:glutamyl-tRNA reductase